MGVDEDNSDHSGVKARGDRKKAPGSMSRKHLQAKSMFCRMELISFTFTLFVVFFFLFCFKYRWWAPPTESWIRTTRLQDIQTHQSQPTSRWKWPTMPSKVSFWKMAAEERYFYLLFQPGVLLKMGRSPLPLTVEWPPLVELSAPHTL